MPVNDPEIVNLIADQWNPAIINALAGAVNILKADVVYYQTFRLTGADAPSNDHAPDDEEFEGVPIYNRRDYIAGQEVFAGGAKFQALSGIDVYVYPQAGDGKIRMDKFE